MCWGYKVEVEVKQGGAEAFSEKDLVMQAKSASTESDLMQQASGASKVSNLKTRPASHFSSLRVYIS
jgi:hypothetical protein